MRPAGTALAGFFIDKEDDMEKNRPIVALDFKSKSNTQKFLDLFSDETLNVKIGMELFYRTGPNFVKKIADDGHEIFLDLKIYDIPNTVKHAMIQLSQLGVSMINVHASGGVEMMQAAKEGLMAGSKEGRGDTPSLIAVTQLTSREDARNVYEQQLAISQEESILHLAKLTKTSGLDGVVCSPHESNKIKETLGEEFQTVTPGIRFSQSTIQNDDQVRITTPREAAERRSDFIVVGRPITQAKDPVESYRMILNEWQKALKGVR